MENSYLERENRILERISNGDLEGEIVEPFEKDGNTYFTEVKDGNVVSTKVGRRQHSFDNRESTYWYPEKETVFSSSEDILDILRRRGYKSDDPDIREYSKEYYSSLPQYDSASRLGSELGLSPQETNYLLYKQGYLEGEPGDWNPTVKGEEYSKYRGDKHPYLAWDAERIKDDLSLDFDERRELREEFKNYKRERRERNREVPLGDDTDSSSTDLSASRDDNANPAVVALIVVGVFVVGYGLYKGGKALWTWGSQKIAKKKEKTISSQTTDTSSSSDDGSSNDDKLSSNISDDINIAPHTFGCNEEEHDDALNSET